MSAAPADPAGQGDAPKSAAAKLFDIRSLIGGLFVLYGIMLTVAGLFTSDHNLAKAAHININLWLGIGMLLIGIFFLAWWRLSPLRHDEPADPAGPAGPAGPAAPGGDAR